MDDIVIPRKSKNRLQGEKTVSVSDVDRPAKRVKVDYRSAYAMLPTGPTVATEEISDDTKSESFPESRSPLRRSQRRTRSTRNRASSGSLGFKAGDTVRLPGQYETYVLSHVLKSLKKVLLTRLTSTGVSRFASDRIWIPATTALLQAEWAPEGGSCSAPATTKPVSRPTQVPPLIEVGTACRFCRVCGLEVRYGRECVRCSDEFHLSCLQSVFLSAGSPWVCWTCRECGFCQQPLSQTPYVGVSVLGHSFERPDDSASPLDALRSALPTSSPRHPGSLPAPEVARGDPSGLDAEVPRGVAATRVALHLIKTYNVPVRCRPALEVGTAERRVWCGECGVAAHGICCPRPLPNLYPSLVWKCYSCVKCSVCQATSATNSEWGPGFEHCSRCFHLLLNGRLCASCNYEVDPREGSHCEVCHIPSHYGCSAALKTRRRCSACASRSASTKLKQAVLACIVHDVHKEFLFLPPSGHVQYWSVIQGGGTSLTELKKGVEYGEITDSTGFLNRINRMTSDAMTCHMPNSAIWKHANDLQQFAVRLLGKLFPESPPNQVAAEEVNLRTWTANADISLGVRMAWIGAPVADTRIATTLRSRLDAFTALHRPQTPHPFHPAGFMMSGCDGLSRIMPGMGCVPAPGRLPVGYPPVGACLGWGTANWGWDAHIPWRPPVPTRTFAEDSHPFYLPPTGTRQPTDLSGVKAAATSAVEPCQHSYSLVCVCCGAEVPAHSFADLRDIAHIPEVETLPFACVDCRGSSPPVQQVVSPLLSSLGVIRLALLLQRLTLQQTGIAWLTALVECSPFNFLRRLSLSEVPYRELFSIQPTEDEALHGEYIRRLDKEPSVDALLAHEASSFSNLHACHNAKLQLERLVAEISRCRFNVLVRLQRQNLPPRQLAVNVAAIEALKVWTPPTPQVPARVPSCYTSTGTCNACGVAGRLVVGEHLECYIQSRRQFITGPFLVVTEETSWTPRTLTPKTSAIPTFLPLASEQFPLVEAGLTALSDESAARILPALLWKPDLPQDLPNGLTVVSIGDLPVKIGGVAVCCPLVVRRRLPPGELSPVARLPPDLDFLELHVDKAEVSCTSFKGQETVKITFTSLTNCSIALEAFCQMVYDGEKIGASPDPMALLEEVWIPSTLVGLVIRKLASKDALQAALRRFRPDPVRSSSLGGMHGASLLPDAGSPIYRARAKTRQRQLLEKCLQASPADVQCSSWLEARVVVGLSAIHGLGLFAQTPILKDEPIIEYVGELIRGAISDVRESWLSLESVDASCYMFRLDDEWVVDATLKGNRARFINHSCSPNSLSLVTTVSQSQGKRIVIFAKEDIAAGTEITYDYQFSIEAETNKIVCHCKAPNCQGRMN